VTTYTLGSGALAGVTINGSQAYQQIGRDLSRLGDVNGDGIDDFITSVSYFDISRSGGAFLILGKDGGVAPVNSSALASNLAITLKSPSIYNSPIDHVSAAGDVNGDGLQDFLISDTRYADNLGRVYLVYGSRNFAGTVDLGNLGSGGMMFTGLTTSDRFPEGFGSGIADLGDVNADGIDDFFIGAGTSSAYGAYSGRGWVIYGKTGGIGPINLAAIAPADGFNVKGGPGMFAGESVSGLGDVNADGIDDFVVNASGAAGGAGTAFVIYGKAGGPGEIDLANFAPANGYSITGTTNSPIWRVDDGGDINGDGIQDIILRSNTSAYVIFGTAGGSANINLASGVPAGRGFIVSGSESIIDAASAGDLNGDGFDDLIVGIPFASNFETQARDAGKAAVVYGGASLSGTISLDLLADSAGFILRESVADARAGTAVGTVGDVNHDGLADILVAAPQTNTYSGTDYLIYGMLPTVSVTRIGGAANQSIYGGAQADVLSGLAGNDHLIGNGGDDRLIGGSGTDVLDGGAGIDTADYASETGSLGVFVNINESYVLPAGFTPALTRDVGPGQALDSFGNVDTLVGIENVRTGGGNDVAIGSNSDNRIETGAGDDVLNGAGGGDTMLGGAGNDLYYVDNGGDVVTENAGEGTDEVRTSLLVYELGANVENLTAVGGFGRTFRDNALGNVITGDDGGADFMFVQAGGTDRVLGLGGNDTFVFGSTFGAADYVDGGAGNDTLALQGNCTLTFGTGLVSNIAGLENIALLSGVNTRFGEPGTNRFDYNLTMLDANVAAGQVLRINGGNLVAGEDFTFDGSAETDGGFVVYAGLGTDIFKGGKQTDVFFFGDSLSYAPGDIADGGEGYDGLFFRGDYTIDFTQPGYAGGLISIENITLSSASDERYQRGGDGEFDYRITLSDGIVQPGTIVTINGGGLMANETMYLDASRETNGHLRLFGGAADDTLITGEGNDLLYGGRGADQLNGGGAADTFRYDETADSTASAMDRITGFTPFADKIDLSRIDANSFAAGDQAFRWIGTSAFSGQGAASAGELHTRFAGGLWYVEGDVNGDGTADLVISMTTPGNAAITEADFLF
jgi:Ca2+-binding RTX toxin-like protein